jgi:hypothetical protein
MPFTHGDLCPIMQLAGRTKGTLERLLEKATATKIDRLSALFTESFRYLLRKQTLIHRIVIDPGTFEVTLYDDAGSAVARLKFRWCTERLKIRPSNKFIQGVVNRYGNAILVLGTRKAESQVREGRINSQQAHALDGEELRRQVLRRNVNLPNSLVYTPIEDWNNDDVWLYLLQVKNPWGHDNRALLTMYRGGQRRRGMPAGGRYQYAQLRRQPVRLLGVHGDGQGPVHGGHDRKRRREGVDDPSAGAAQRAGQARRPRPAGLSAHERAGAAVS